MKKKYKPTKYLLKTIDKARRDRKTGKSSPIFSSVAEMKMWLDSLDITTGHTYKGKINWL